MKEGWKYIPPKRRLTFRHCTALKSYALTPRTKKLKKKPKFHGLSPRANYTGRASASGRRSDCQLFADRGCHVVSVTDPYGRILGFLDRSPLLHYQVAPQLYLRG
jgi:hypothetical protein